MRISSDISLLKYVITFPFASPKIYLTTGIIYIFKILLHKFIIFFFFSLLSYPSYKIPSKKIKILNLITLLK